MKMRILWVVAWGREHAPTRHRAYVYAPFLEDLAECNRYVSGRYQYGAVRAKLRETILTLVRNESAARIFSSLLTELGRILHFIMKSVKVGLPLIRSDKIIYVRCFPGFTQKILLRLFTKDFYFDFDDALFLEKPGTGQSAEGAENPLMQKKIAGFIRTCSGVIVSNSYLAEWAGDYNNNVAIVPTSVEINEQTLKKRVDRDKIVLGWVGAPENQKYLEKIFPALQSLMQERPGMVMHVVTSNHRDYGHKKVRPITWRLATYEDEIRKFTVGLAPLDDTPWTRGKMQFRAIQYAVQRIPIVGSPTGFNPEYWKDNENILFARNSEEFKEKLEMLLDDPVLRKEMGHRGFDTVKKYYSARVNSKLLVQYLEQF
jgi:glycosyltransferase involved in cell wall biosynthesis